MSSFAFQKKQIKKTRRTYFFYLCLASVDAPVLFCFAPLTPGCKPTSSLLTRGYQYFAPMGLVFKIVPLKKKPKTQNLC
jgi:hypothetical protein